MNFDPNSSLFASKLRALIEDRKAETVESVSYSRGVTDFASYQRLVGQIAGFDEVLVMFEDVNRIIAKEEGRR